MSTSNGSSAISPTTPSSSTPRSASWRPPSRTSTNGRQPRFERVSEIFDRVKANISQRNAIPELPFGIPALDDLTAGLIRGKIAVVAARSSQGKTSLALQTAWNLADAGKTVAYVTLEDDREELVERLWCHVERVDNQALRRGVLPPESPITRQVFERVKLLALDQYGYNVEEIAEVVDRLEPMPDVVVVDYAQMIDDDLFESEYRAISLFVRQLKMLAEHTKIAVLLCSQINRQGAREGRPELHHLARCGRLEEVANLVVSLYCPFYAKDQSFDYQAGPPVMGFPEGECPPEYFEAEVLKNKTGPKGFVRLRFVGKHYLFQPWPVLVAEELVSSGDAEDRVW